MQSPESDNIEADNTQAKRRWQDYGLIKDEVVRILDGHPEGLTGAGIAEHVGITQGAMSKYLSMLKVDGVIISRKVGVAKLWKLVSQSDRTDMLAEKIGDENEVATFKDYAVSILEENNKLYESDGKRVLVMPSIMLSSLYKSTKSLIGTEAHAFFYEWGRDYAGEVNSLADEITKKTGGDFLNSFLELWKLKGWGRFEVASTAEDSVEIAWFDSVLAEELSEKTGVDDFVAGALARALSYSKGGSWRVSEVKCKAAGAPNCLFQGTRNA